MPIHSLWPPLQHASQVSCIITLVGHLSPKSLGHLRSWLPCWGFCLPSFHPSILAGPFTKAHCPRPCFWAAALAVVCHSGPLVHASCSGLPALDFALLGCWAPSLYLSRLISPPTELQVPDSCSSPLRLWVHLSWARGSWPWFSLFLGYGSLTLVLPLLAHWPPGSLSAAHIIFFSLTLGQAQGSRGALQAILGPLDLFCSPKPLV